MSDENDAEVEGNKGGVLSTIVNVVSETVRGPAGELKALQEDGSDDALREMVQNFGSTYHMHEVLDFLEENGGEVAMSLPAVIVINKVQSAVCDDDLSELEFLTERVLKVFEENGNDAAIRGVFDVMMAYTDDAQENKDDMIEKENFAVVARCEAVIKNSNNEGVKQKLDVLLSGNLPETEEDEHNHDDLLPS